MIVIIIMIRKKGEKEPKIISSKPSTKITERQKLYQKSNWWMNSIHLFKEFKYPMSHPLKEFKYSM